MMAVTVSSKFQIVIPKEGRDSMGIVSGQKIQMLAYCNRTELIPIKPMKKMKGFLKGIDYKLPLVDSIIYDFSVKPRSLS